MCVSVLLPPLIWTVFRIVSLAWILIAEISFSIFPTVNSTTILVFVSAWIFQLPICQGTNEAVLCLCWSFYTFYGFVVVHFSFCIRMPEYRSFLWLLCYCQCSWCCVCLEWGWPSSSFSLVVWNSICKLAGERHSSAYGISSFLFWISAGFFGFFCSRWFLLSKHEAMLLIYPCCAIWIGMILLFYREG